MYDLIFLAIGIPLALAAAAVGRTVIQGPKYGVEQATSRWLLDGLLLLILLGLIGALALVRQSIDQPPTAFDIIEGEGMAPT